MKVVIFGPNGMLGRYIKCFLLDHGYHVICIDRERYDVMNNSFTDLEKLLVEIGLDHDSVIINCIGLIPHTCKDKTDRGYIKINSIFPNVLAHICQRYNAKMIHPTTDCVFSGQMGGYDEMSEHDATDIYGVSKSLGEPELASVIRCSIIGEEVTSKRSFIEWVRSNREGEINGYLNHYWNGVTCLQYAKIVEQIIRENLFWKGVRHIMSPDIVTKYDMTCFVNDVYDLGIKIDPYMCPIKCDRSLKSLYDCSHFCIPIIKEQIKEQEIFRLY